MEPRSASELFAAPFALSTLSDSDGPAFPALVVPDGEAVDLRGVFGHPRLTVLDLLDRWDENLPRLRALASDETLAWTDLDGLQVCAPVAPRQVLQSGADFGRHAIDLGCRVPGDERPDEERRGETAEITGLRPAEDLPYVFIGLPSAITGPYDDVVLPAWAEKPDWKLELAVVIGRSAHRVSVEDAPRYIAGYTIANDLTDRATVFRRDMAAIGTDWLRSKNAPGFTPLGPWIVPAESLAHPDDLRVTLKLNGETMQDESTTDMTFKAARVVSYASQTAQLLPGDLVLTGSPASKGMRWGRLLRDGDVMEGTVTGLGVQRTRCLAEASS
ncbi:fumarylacetoacetate hydrolase family protein [Streptomyces sp. HD1123-B1]|uniref:fumarylacetoacetate hydrolase family protein n=1 Tax=Streptomyces huangiella TaxID=3228804 RepID=UPI003D7C369A